MALPIRSAQSMRDHRHHPDTATASRQDHHHWPTNADERRGELQRMESEQSWTSCRELGPCGGGNNYHYSFAVQSPYNTTTWRSRKGCGRNSNSWNRLGLERRRAELLWRGSESAL